MARNFNFNPHELQQSGCLQLPTIPINSYQSDVQAEIKEYGKEQLVRVYFWLRVLRLFESMLDSLKKKGSYDGIDYTPKGPAHLAIGQETVCVGQALALDRDDQIFGSHRSHGEILAKSFVSSRLLKENDLTDILETYAQARIWRIIEEHWQGENIYDTCENFILYALLAEIFARETGLNGGLGGSMHAFFAPLGSMPNNAIVGGSADIAVGAALYKLIRQKKGIALANIGDGSLSSGAVWEALVMASMDQYKTLWKMEKYPPYLLCVMNNFYAMGGQPVGETMSFGVAARLGAAVNPQAMHAERVNGFDPLAVADAMKRKKSLLLKGEGPALLDIITYRYSGHSPSDAMSYRSKEELNSFMAEDPIERYAAKLKENALLTAAEQQMLDKKAASKIYRALSLSVDEQLSPYCQGNNVEKVMYSLSNHPLREEDKQCGQAELSATENPRTQQLKTKQRYAFDSAGQKFSPLKLYNYRDAIFEAIFERFSQDPGLVSYGEELRDWGGAFGCYRGLTESLPYHRLFNAPIAEGAIIGSAAGYALNGGCALVELMYCDFIGRAGDQIFNQLCKWQAMSNGVLPMAVVVRVSVGSKYGAQHSQDWSSICAHLPGLQVMYPASPYDAKGMLLAALQASNPVIFFESQKLYAHGEEFHKEGVPETPYSLQTAEPDIKRHGKDLSLISLGPALYTAMETAEILSKDFQLEAEVIDLRFLNPLNYQILDASLRKTGRGILISEAVENNNFMHTVASHLQKNNFDYLDAPLIVQASQNWIAPPAELEKSYFPQTEDILKSIDQHILPLSKK